LSDELYLVRGRIQSDIVLIVQEFRYFPMIIKRRMSLNLPATILMVAICFLIRRQMMSVNWSKHIDQTLIAAKEQSRPILLDFSAAPA
jgi:hypothetical protein